MEVSSLTDKQLKAFNQFKQECQDLIQPYDDRFLLKWLKAREFNAKKSADMFRKSMAWRKQIGADTLEEKWDPPEVLKKYYAGGSCGYDKEGHPVWIDLASYMDFKGLLHSVQKSDIVKYEARQLEVARRLMREQSKKLGRTIDQVTVIMDVEKMSMKHLWSPGVACFNEIMEMTEDNYPENLRMLFIVNAPRLFPVGYNIVKPLLGEETRGKIQILGNNWRETVLEYIDPDQLPEHWGGNLTDTDGDPYCRSKIGLGGEVPKSFYLKEQQSLPAEHLTSTTVDRGSLFQVRLNVAEPGSAIRWEFKTQTYDIGFGILKATDPKQEKVNDMTPIVPVTKANSELVTQDGIVTCHEAGTYVVAFDNRYSWMHNKELSYLVEIIKPAHHTDEMNNDVTKQPNGGVHTMTEASEVTPL